MIYLVIDTIGSSTWFYRGIDDDPILKARVSVPTGAIYLSNEMLTFKPPKSLLEETSILSGLRSSREADTLPSGNNPLR